jgi:hypothetical protein
MPKKSAGFSWSIYRIRGIPAVLVEAQDNEYRPPHWRPLYLLVTMSPYLAGDTFLACVQRAPVLCSAGAL